MSGRTGAFAGAWLFTLLFAGCGGGGPPPREIDAAVRAYVEEHGLPPIGQSCMWGSKLEIDEVRTVEVGERQEAMGHRSWPVRARVIGGCRAQDRGYSAQMASEWDRTFEFSLHQNGFGEWEASPAG